MWPAAKGRVREDESKSSQEAIGVFGLHSQGWAAGQVGQEGSSPALPHCHHPGHSADTMVFQSKHADTRGNFHLNSSCLSFCPETLQKHDQDLCGERG